MSGAELLEILALPGVYGVGFVPPIDVFGPAHFRLQPAPDMKSVVIALERGSGRGVVGAAP